MVSDMEMKKYILTAWDDYEPTNGLDVIQASYNTLDECCKHEENYKYDNIVVYDRDTLKEIKVLYKAPVKEIILERRRLTHIQEMHIHIKTFLKHDENYDLTDLNNEEYDELLKFFYAENTEKRYKTLVYKDKKVSFSYKKIKNSLPYLDNLPL